jgi:DNA-binding XRE family transcriptional regulator
VEARLTNREAGNFPHRRQRNSTTPPMLGMAGTAAVHYTRGLVLPHPMRPQEILAANLIRLMDQQDSPSSGVAVDKAAAALGLQISRSTVTRISHGDSNPSLQHVEVLAKVFGVQSWQLLHPTMGKSGDDRSPANNPFDSDG